MSSPRPAPAPDRPLGDPDTIPIPLQSGSHRPKRAPERHIPPGYAIRDALVSDLPATSRLHVGELEVGLFPQLGRRFVARWHRTYQQSPHAVALSVVRTYPRGREHIVGFLIGATDRDSFLQELITRHRNALLLHGALALLLRPRVLGRFLRTRLRPYLRRLRSAARRSDAVGADPATPRERTRTADLAAIVIAPSLRHTGVGSALVQEFLRRCAAAGAATAELLTVSGPSGASGFYSRVGWTLTETCVSRDGVQVQRFHRRTCRAAEEG
jgi:GNAT superfamily N-acetyltransferase